MQVVDDFLEGDVLVCQSPVDDHLPEPFGGTGSVGIEAILRGLDTERRRAYVLFLAIDEKGRHLVSEGCLVRLAVGGSVEADVGSRELRTGGLANLLQDRLALGGEGDDVGNGDDDARPLLLLLLLRFERPLIISWRVPRMTTWAQIVAVRGLCWQPRSILVAASTVPRPRAPTHCSPCIASPLLLFKSVRWNTQ